MSTVLVEEFLLVPELPQPRRAIGLDAARGLQRVEVVGAEIAAVDLQGADVERAAVQPNARCVSICSVAWSGRRIRSPGACRR